LSENTRPDPFFIADNSALDFLNSVCAPWGKDIEWISDGRDLLGWLTKAGMIAPDISVRFRDEIPVEALDSIARQARELREWFRGFVSTHAGNPLAPATLDELETLNRLLAQDHAYRQIDRNDLTDHDKSGSVYTLRWRQERRWQSAEDLLFPIAEAMGDLICGADFTYIKNCEGPTCTLWFLDVSRNHTRRWCTMAVCGNRAKAAAHRAKSGSKNPRFTEKPP